MDEIKKLYQEAEEALAKGRAILDEYKGKESEMPKEKSEEADRYLNEAQVKAEKAKELEGNLAREQKFAQLEAGLKDGKNRLPAFQNKTGDGKVAKVVWNGKEYQGEDLEELKRLSTFPGFLSTLDDAGMAYAKAFDAYCRKNFRDLKFEERKALSAGDSGAGGILVQDTFLTTLLVKAREMSAMRRISDVLPPVPSGSVIYPSEESFLSDATWTTEVKTGSADVVKPFGGRALTPHALAKRLLVSNTLMRIPGYDVEAYVRDGMSYKFAVPEEAAYINGTGVNQPLGLLNTAGLPTSTTAVALTVDADDVINWIYSLPAAYVNANTRILCHRSFVRKVRTMKTGLGDYVWQPGLQQGSPSKILDVPYEFSDQFDDGLDANDAWQASAKIAVVGDFKNYKIVDALRMSIQRLDELYAETNQTGFIGRKETDGMAVLAEAFMALVVHS